MSSSVNRIGAGAQVATAPGWPFGPSGRRLLCGNIRSNIQIKVDG
jgi:hypothetical protein